MIEHVVNHDLTVKCDESIGEPPVPLQKAPIGK